MFFKIPAESRIYTFYKDYKYNTATTLFYTSLGQQKILPLQCNVTDGMYSLIQSKIRPPEINLKKNLLYYD